MIQEPPATDMVCRPATKHPPPAKRPAVPPPGLKARPLREGLIIIRALGHRRSKIVAQRSGPGDIESVGTSHTSQAQASYADESVTQPIAECLSVALVPKASADLRQTHERSQMSRTDIINRAISFYEFADAEQSAGSELRLRRSTGEEHIVKLL